MRTSSRSAGPRSGMRCSTRHASPRSGRKRHAGRTAPPPLDRLALRESSARRPMATVAQEFPPLLLTEGGPGDALLRRLRLAPLGVGSRRAAVVLMGVTWVPLLVLSALQGVAI